MKVQLDNGRLVEFPNGTSDEDALDYINSKFPSAPNVAERAAGHLALGAGRFVDMVSNLTGYTPLGNEATMQGFQDIKSLFTDTGPAIKTAAHPETSLLGQVAGGLTEFIPQLPMYAAGGGLGMGALKVAAPRVAARLAPVIGEGIIKETARAVGRAAVAGGVVGTAAGTPAETGIVTKLKAGGEEAAAFAGAVSVLHPAFKALGFIGRGIFRRMRGKGTIEDIKAELEKKAVRNPDAAEELQRLKEAEGTETETTPRTVEEELYVPKEKGEVEVPPTKEAQGELALEEIAGPEQMARFKELGYEEADLAGLPDKELLLILKQSIVKEVPSAKTDIEGIQGRIREGEEPVSGEPIKGRGRRKAKAGGVLQAPEGEAAKEAGAVTERRVNLIERKRIADMSPEEMYKEIENLRKDLLVNNLTGLANKKAYEEKTRRPVQASIDVDSLKWVNDNFGHEAGNDLLRTMGKALEKSGSKDTYHFSGDEFFIEGRTKRDVNQAVANAREYLANNPLMFTDKARAQHVITVKFSHGVGKTMAEAETGLRAEKTAREKSGERAARGAAPTEAVPAAPTRFGKKYTIARNDALTLQRMGFTGKEIRGMTDAEVRENIERVDKVPEPTPEELAKAEAAARTINEAYVARVAEETVVPEKPKMSEAERAKIIEDVEREIAESVDNPEPLTAAAEAIVRAQGADPLLDSLAENVPRGREEILQARRNLVAERVAAAKIKAEKKAPPQTREELEKHLAGVRAKARRGRKTVDYAKEAADWEKKLAEEGMEAELPPEGEEPSDVTLDSLGFQQIYNWVANLGRAERVKAAAPSKRLAAEIDGRVLEATTDIDTTMKAVSKSLWSLTKRKLGSPGFIYAGDPMKAAKNPEMSDHVFQLHKAMFEGKSLASRSNEVVMTSKTLLTPESRLRMKGIIEGKTTTVDPKELEAADMIREELAAVREIVKEHKRRNIQENVNADEWSAISEILAGKDEAEVYAKYRTHIVPDSLGRRRVRSWVNEDVVRDIVKEYKAVDSWGLDNYMTHWERGSLRIVSGKTLFAKAVSLQDAARKFAGLIARDREAGEFREYKLDTEYDVETLATGMSKRAYNLALTKLQKGIQESVEGINSHVARHLAQKGIKDAFFIKPTNKYSPFIEERRNILMGEEDIYDVLPFYFYSMHMKMKLDPVITKVRKALSQQDVVGKEPYVAKDGTVKTRDIKRPHLKAEDRAYLERYVEDVKGRYYPSDQLTDEAFKSTGHKRILSKAIQGARELEANLKLSYAPVKGAINGASGFGYLWTKAGTAGIRDGLKFMRTPEGKTFLDAGEQYLGVNYVESATGEAMTKGTFEKLGILKTPTTQAQKLTHAAIEPLGWFQMPEVPVRKLAMATYHQMAIKSGLSEAAARDVAIRGVWFTEFTYDMAGLPELMRGPIGRLTLQFKPFMTKSIEFMTTLRGAEVARFMTLQLALAGPRGLMIILKSLPILGATGALDKLEEWMNKEYPRLSRGAAGFVGVDVAAPATFQLPQTARDWYGPTLADIVTLNKTLLQPLIEGNGADGVELNKFMGSTFPIYRYWHHIVDQVVDKDGWVKDERGRRLYHIDNTAAFMTKSVLGAEDLQGNRIRTEERILAQRSMRIGDRKTITVDNILDAVQAGRVIDPADIEQMQMLGLTPIAIRRAAKDRVLDARQRRLLRTEIIRRPEILDVFPEAADLR